MRGKYSPTVFEAYRKDQDWFDKYVKTSTEEFSRYDPEGFDSYSYNKDDFDRAGVSEYHYMTNDSWENDEDFNFMFDKVSDEWGFDGAKPVKII